MATAIFFLGPVEGVKAIFPHNAETLVTFTAGAVFGLLGAVLMAWGYPDVPVESEAYGATFAYRDDKSGRQVTHPCAAALIVNPTFAEITGFTLMIETSMVSKSTAETMTAIHEFIAVHGAEIARGDTAFLGALKRQANP